MWCVRPYAARLHMPHCLLSITTATALLPPRVHTVPGPCAPICQVPTGVQADAELLQCAATRTPCSPSLPIPTLAGRSTRATSATNGRGSTAGVRETATAFAGDVSDLSVAAETVRARCARACTCYSYHVYACIIAY